MTMKGLLLSLRNRFHPKNSIRIENGATFTGNGNLLSTHIVLPAGNHIVIGEGARLRKVRILVRGNGNRLEIGRDVIFSGNMELFGNGNSIRIGDNSRINGATLLAHHGTSIQIGRECLFSTEIDIRTTDSHRIFDRDGVWINRDKDIVIGDKVWLGRLVSVLKGSHIGDGSVVGTMSLVVGHLPKRVTCAGVPAKVIREEIDWA